MMRNAIGRTLIAVLVLAVMAQLAAANIRVSKLGRLVGWTVVADTYIRGDFEGPDYEKVVRLDNGWIIEFNDYDYFYEYHPEIVILAKQVDGVTLYKTVIEGGDDIYDVTRLH